MLLGIRARLVDTVCAVPVRGEESRAPQVAATSVSRFILTAVFTGRMPCSSRVPPLSFSHGEAERDRHAASETHFVSFCGRHIHSRLPVPASGPLSSFGL